MRDFALPRARSTGFGSHGRDSGRFHTPSLALTGCGPVGFPTASGFYPLNLATAVNSLPRVSRRTVQPRSPSLVLPRRRGFLREGSLLSGRTHLSPPGFRLFSPPSRGAFQLSLTVLVRYRSRDVFRVGSRCLPASRRISNRRYSGSPETLRAYAYGAITLSGAAFQRTSASPPRLQRRALQHHIPWVFPPRVQFALCRFRSPLLTASLLLSFPAGTKMFQFPAFPLPDGSAAKAAGGPIRESPARRLPAPHRGLSQLATPFVSAPSRAIHQAA